MRRAFVKGVEKELEENENCILLLGDIGVYGFKTSFERYPNRVYNIGICEQSMVSLAAGMALEGMIPTIHTIAPFVVERALEQIKIDFGYQKLRGNIVTVGSSIDYASLGCTHHCPGDIATLLNIPEVQIVVPGHANEFLTLYGETARNESLTYTRLSEASNSKAMDVQFGKGLELQTGSKATVICVGPTLDQTINACKDLDVSILYMTTVFPFDGALLEKHYNSGKIMLVEPFYSHTLTPLIVKHLKLRNLRFASVGIPRSFIRTYGTTEEQYEGLGFTSESIRISLLELIDA